MNEKRTIYRLCESALMLAFAAVLSVIKLIDMPYGGSVTLFSMLPLIIIAYRYGTRWGLLTGFAYGLIQLLLGMDNLSYATSFGAGVAIILFDYGIAFTVLGLGGIFRKMVPSQGVALSLGAVLTGGLRYLCHVISGCTVWYGLSVPTGESLVYSFGYNIYMVPETLLLVIGAVYVSRLLNFNEFMITRAAPIRAALPISTVLTVIGTSGLLAAAIWDVVEIVPHLQSEEAAILLSGLAQADWMTMGIVTGGAILLFVVTTWIARRLNQKGTS